MKKLLSVVILVLICSPYIFAETKKNEIFFPDSITALINKENYLPANYVPSDLTVPKIPARTYTHENSMLREEAARHLEKLYNAASAAGYEFFSVSGYRSYSLQKAVFDAEVRRVGMDKALTQVAYPGTSEHQSGLAMDISSDEMGGGLYEKFGDTEVGRWVAKNCHKYGFIIRYPKDKVHITLYDYEPWHLRYVGNDFAGYLYDNNLCMEEYFNLNAKYRTYPIILNGEKINLFSYNIDGYSYFKLRDIAELLKNTRSLFDINWNEKLRRVEIEKKAPYKSSESSFSKTDGFNKKAQKSDMKVYLSDVETRLSGYLINGNNYYKLRDLGEILDFDVEWIESEKTIFIKTE